MLLASDLKPKDIDVINESLLYVTLNQLVGRCRSSSLVELALEVRNHAN